MCISNLVYQDAPSLDVWKCLHEWHHAGTRAAMPQDGCCLGNASLLLHPLPPRARWELDSHHQKLQFAQNNVKSYAGVSGQPRLPRRAAHMQISGLMSPACRTEDRENQVREERVERGKREKGKKQDIRTRGFYIGFLWFCFLYFNQLTYIYIYILSLFTHLVIPYLCD